MSKRTQTRERVADRQKQSRRQRLILGGVVAGLVVVVIFLIFNSAGRTPPVAQARLDLDPVQGKLDAPITIVEYGAYSCPSCRQWHQAGVVKQLLAQYPDKVRFVFRDYPVISPTYDQMAAEIAQCALDQGEEQFWKLHDALYTTISAGSSEETILQTAEQLGLDSATLRTCADAHTNRLTVQYDLTRGHDLALPGTPSFLVNGQRIFDASPDTLATAVQQALSGS